MWPLFYARKRGPEAASRNEMGIGHSSFWRLAAFCASGTVHSRHVKTMVSWVALSTAPGLVRTSWAAPTSERNTMRKVSRVRAQ